MSAESAALVLPPIISAVSGLLGALIGGGASLLASHLSSEAAATRSRQEAADHRQKDRNERILAKGEEMVSLLASSGEWHRAVTDSALTIGHSKLLEYPSAPFRVEALVLAYFPKLENPFLIRFNVAVAHLHSSIVEMLSTKLTSDSYQSSYEELRSSASALRGEVLKTMHSTNGA